MNKNYKCYAITTNKSDKFLMLFQCFDKKMENLIITSFKKNKQLRVIEVSYEEK